MLDFSRVLKTISKVAFSYYVPLMHVYHCGGKPQFHKTLSMPETIGELGRFG